MSVSCPLCSSNEIRSTLTGQDGRTFYQCGNCQLIYAKAEVLPSAEVEHSEYLSHENTIENEGYVRFLRQALDPTLGFIHERRAKESASDETLRFLDFGCGPGPVLSELVELQGYKCEIYDPFFYPVMPAGQFDVIFATECFEHFHSPAKTLAEIGTKLSPGGLLAVLTEQYTDIERFSDWYYTRDKTHVSFYNKATFAWICAHFGLRMVAESGRRFVLLEKQ